MSHAIARVAILGGESTGKSTLAAALAAHYQTVWVPEYLRDFVENNQRTPQAIEQLQIATTQREREAALLSQAQQFLFCDTTPRMTAAYSRYYFEGNDDALEALANACQYDFTIVATPSNPWVGDGLQRDSDAARHAVHDIVCKMLDDASIPYLLAVGDEASRVQQAVTYLQNTKPYSPR